MIEAAPGAEFSPAALVNTPEPSATAAKARWSFAGLGLLVTFGFLFMPLKGFSNLVFQLFEIPWLTIRGVEEVALKLLASLLLIAIVVRGEHRSIRSIGLKPPRLSDLGLGFAAFVLAEISMYACESIVPSFRFDAAGKVALFTRSPMWLIVVGALVNGIYEELGAHGFAIERLSELTHSLTIGAAIAFALDIAVHVPYWGWQQAIILAPGLAVFTALYVWRRSLTPCIVAHVLGDAVVVLWPLLGAFAFAHLTPYLSYDYQGSSCYRKGDFDRAIALYSSALARNPRDVYALQWRGLSWLNNKDYDQSLADLTEAIRLDPRRGDSYAHRAFVYSTHGDEQDAMADLDQAIKLQPDDASSYEMRARIESRRGDHRSAREDYRHALRLDASDAQLHSEVAYEAYQLDDFAEAAAQYYSTVRFTPDDAAAWEAFAMASNDTGKYDEALSAVAHAMKIGGATSESYQILMDAHVGLDRLDLAMGDLTKAIALQPKDANLYARRGWMHEQNNDDADAIADYDASLALAPHPGEGIYNSMAWILATSSNPQLRNGKRAIELATRSCDLSAWSNGYEIDTLAAAYAEAGDFAHAIENETKAIALLGSKADDLKHARLRLDLYQHGKAYHRKARLQAPEGNLN